MKASLLLTVLALIGSVDAAPIRVGIFKGVGGGGSYWHPSIHPGAAAIAAMLSDPTQAGLVDPPVPVRGFSVTMYGVDTSCNIAGCTPSAQQTTAFISALDSLDVAIFPNNVRIGGVIENPDQRQRLATFWMNKGVVSLHWSADGRGAWAPWDTLHGAVIGGWQADGVGTFRRDTAGSAPQSASWKFLNRGLPDTARVREEWSYFTTSGATIRSKPYVVPTVNIDENSFSLNGTNAMGDHPISWYREFPAGGRFFYTDIGHRTQNYDSSFFFRRQLYNAVLWASKDTTGWDANTTGIRPVDGTRSGKGPTLHVSRGALQVQIEEDATWRVEIHGLNGRLIASRHGDRRSTVSFTGLTAPTVYVVTLTTARSRGSRRIIVE